ncbi:hypothetical protein CCACVL1_20069 [Corchorus capsularis]|uniref:Uncharacterized protein n=1 Tax=Corchorus capsularis TaxID=210143 RepID=A0A1R3HCQ3_COCAP|nr:hypothetical protein CCACVL1_20069 [Corchorus capsularis]
MGPNVFGAAQFGAFSDGNGAVHNTHC